MAKTCDGCRFYENIRDKSGRISPEAVGFCRRMPPTIISPVTRDDVDFDVEVDIWWRTRFPIVNHDDWCGHWEQ